MVARVNSSEFLTHVKLTFGRKSGVPRIHYIMRT